MKSNKRVKKNRSKKMKVELIRYTEDGDNMCGAIARSCYSRNDVDNLISNGEDYTGTLRDVIDSGHLSVVEHSTYTFTVSGVSRVLTHQLVRHRIASFTQQSQRYVRMDSSAYVIPPSILEDKETYDIYTRHAMESNNVYEKLRRRGVPQEDARYILPAGIYTNITITMNARQLLHFFSLRCCNRAQWEIRQMANEMLKECKRVAPITFATAGAPCKRGDCPEGSRSCKGEDNI